MLTKWICRASSTSWTMGDYWISDTDRDDDETLVGDTLDDLYEEIARYKLNHEILQAPNDTWRVKQGYKNYNDYTKVHFDTIYQVVIQNEELDTLGRGIEPDRILFTQVWIDKLAREQVVIDAEKEKNRLIAEKTAKTRAANKAAAVVRAEKRLAAIERKRAK